MIEIENPQADAGPDFGHVFAKPELLRQALTHPSVRYEEKKSGVHDNQRLEFLGDAVLQSSISHALYERFPNWDEGKLTRVRARMVNKTALAGLARTLGLGVHLILGRGEERNDGRQRESNLADALEAIIGAIYLDAGFVTARMWILRVFSELLESGGGSEEEFNSKGVLQELLQGRGVGAPEYELRHESGPDHMKVYEVAVISQGKELACGSGSNKKRAEMAAAAVALKILSAQQDEQAADG